eukprot:2461927-Rhodomonas_salina.1
MRTQARMKERAQEEEQWGVVVIQQRVTVTPARTTVTEKGEEGVEPWLSRSHLEVHFLPLQG